MDDKLKESLSRGDKVNVYFSIADAIFGAEILWTPGVEGEGYTLRLSDGRIANVQHYEVIEEVPRGR